MDTQDINKFSYKNIKEKFDFVTSSNGSNWLLALNWIFILEFFSSIIEYEFVQKSQSFVEPLISGFAKEFSIAVLIVIFIWYSVYNFIFMQKQKFFIFTIYISICIYLLVTNDVSFNLLLHNMNPLELFIDGIGFYMFIQIILKLLILYLIFKMMIAFKYRNTNS